MQVRERKKMCWVLHLKGFKGRDFLGEDLNSTFISFQVCLLRVVVSTDWSEPGWGIISHCSWP